MPFESLNRAAQHRDNRSDPTKMSAILTARKLLESAGVIDPGEKVRAEDLIDPAIAEALKGVGYTFFHLIEPKSLETLKKEYPEHFNHVNSSQQLRGIIPEVIVAAVNPDQLFLPDGVNLPVDQQEAIVQVYGLELKTRDPRLKAVKFEIPHVSTVVQLDLAWNASHRGKDLLNRFVRIIDKTGMDYTGDPYAFVGRNFSLQPLSVLDKSDERIGVPHIWVMPVAMIPLQPAA